MQNKKLMIAGIVALAVVLVLVTLSYKKQQSQTPGMGGIGGSATAGVISKNNPAGTYIAFLPAADTRGRTITLQLNADAGRSASMTTDYQNAQAPLVDLGTWESTARGFKIAFTSKNGLVLTKAEALEFAVTKTAVQLINPDKVTWGANGLTLALSSLQLPSEWTWISTTLADGKQITAQPNKLFTITLGSDNRVAVRGDCNSISGTFGFRSNNGIVFSPLASTRMYCEGSREDVFVQDLARATSFTLKGDTLLLTLPNGSGMMTFGRRVTQNAQ